MKRIIILIVLFVVMLLPAGAAYVSFQDLYNFWQTHQFSGPPGPAGTNGVSGTNGVNGVNGTNGTGGINGSLPYPVGTLASTTWILGTNAVVVETIYGAYSLNYVVPNPPYTTGTLWVKNGAGAPYNFTISASAGTVHGWNSTNVFTIPPGGMYAISVECNPGSWTNFVWSP